MQARHWRAEYLEEKNRCEKINEEYMQALDAMVAANADCFRFYPAALREVQRRAEQESDRENGMSGFYERLWRQHVHEDGNGDWHDMFEI